MKFKVGVLAAMMVVVSAVMVGISPPAFADCSSGSHSGDNNNGSWTFDYDAGCNGVNNGSVTVHWYNWTDSNGHRWDKYDFSLWAGNLGSGKCMQIALDWNIGNITGAFHGDAQIMRNCNSFSTYDMTAQSIDLDADPALYHALGPTPLARLQMSTYDNGLVGSRTNPECPNTLAPRTDGELGTCASWNPVADFNSKAAKIRRLTVSGTPQQNTPTYPTNYGVDFMLDNDF